MTRFLRTMAKQLAFAFLGWLVAAISLIGLLLGGCAHVGPVLDDVLGRGDVGRLWACRAHRGTELARCIGIEVASQAVGIAADLALERLERARELGSGGAGAADHTEADRRMAAADLEVALSVLDREATVAALESGGAR